MHHLETSFTSTNYEVYPADNQTFTIRLNQPNLALHQFLRQHAATTFAFITACNPMSQEISPVENKQRNYQLAAALMNYHYYPAAGVPAAGEEWQPEESFFVLNITRGEAVELGRKYQQLAILFGEIEKKPELVWLLENK